jgi:hypothetical protein
MKVENKIREFLRIVAIWKLGKSFLMNDYKKKQTRKRICFAKFENCW